MAENREDLNEVFDFLKVDISKSTTNDLYIMYIHLKEYIEAVKRGEDTIKKNKK